MGKVLPAIFTALFFISAFAAGQGTQSTLSEGAAKFWTTWFYVPAKYLISWPTIIMFAVAPVVIALFFAYEIWKELGIFHSGAANFWIPLLIVYIMLPNGFWGYVDLFVSNTQMIPALVLSFFALQITSKLKARVTSFGYSGIFGGVVAYVLEAVGGGVFLGSIGFIISKGRFGPLVYALFFAGAALGLIILWWDKKRRKTGVLKNVMGQEDVMRDQEKILEQALKDLNQRLFKATGDAEKTAIEDEMARINQRLERLKARATALELSAA
ncbi:MAG: hypothetical protein HY051_02285 [Candidatus Aenigmarchaeota archaeon]|nr:hypothetical protein [Candidatus Aenigmarchaeota archaeon]